MPSFGGSSQRNLDTCDNRLAIGCNALIEVIDFSVTEGHRTRSDQDRYFLSGASKLPFPNSKHNLSPSKAVHLVPYHPIYRRLIGSREQIGAIAISETERTGRKFTEQQADAWIREQYTYLAGRYIEAMRFLGVQIRWGGDWDQDGDLLDNRFDDLAHFEIEE